MTSQVKQSAREVRRLQTRERILGAAIAEFKQSGMAGADVNAIVGAAGVAHGTFFFHFPARNTYCSSWSVAKKPGWRRSSPDSSTADMTW